MVVTPYDLSQKSHVRVHIVPEIYAMMGNRHELTNKVHGSLPTMPWSRPPDERTAHHDDLTLRVGTSQNQRRGVDPRKPRCCSRACNHFSGRSDVQDKRQSYGQGDPFGDAPLASMFNPSRCRG
jgi:hypothetical protein